MTPLNLDIAAKLDEARALIEKGWTRGTLCRRGRVCAAGAIYAAFNGSPIDTRRSPSVIRSFELLSDASGWHYTGVWNDEQKSKAPVIEAFKRAAELARAEA